MSDIDMVSFFLDGRSMTLFGNNSIKANTALLHVENPVNLIFLTKLAIFSDIYFQCEILSGLSQ